MGGLPVTPEIDGDSQLKLELVTTLSIRQKEEIGAFYLLERVILRFVQF